jgi:hypothetical protein
MELTDNSNQANNNINHKRCIGLNIHQKKCKNKIRDNNKFFCSKSHEPFNIDFIENGCFTCGEIIEDPNSIIIFKCNHIFHKDCYMEWLKYSTYDKPICLICKNEVNLNKQNNNNNKKKTKIVEDSSYIFKNLAIINNL